ncbi:MULTISPECIES: hypothetical protein [Arthrobacter]|nr:hypothetical protein [Arthrobacter sp. lap29]
MSTPFNTGCIPDAPKLSPETMAVSPPGKYSKESTAARSELA